MSLTSPHSTAQSFAGSLLWKSFLSDAAFLLLTSQQKTESLQSFIKVASQTEELEQLRANLFESCLIFGYGFKIHVRLPGIKEFNDDKREPLFKAKPSCHSARDNYQNPNAIISIGEQALHRGSNPAYSRSHLSILPLDECHKEHEKNQANGDP